MAPASESPIVARLRALKGRIRFILLSHSTLMFVLFAAAMVVGSFLLDWLFHLPVEARTGLLLIMVGTMFWGAYRFFLGPFKVPLDDHALALVVQRARPEIGDELISALQFGRKIADPGETESKDMMAAAVTRANERYGESDFSDAVSARGLRRPLLQALGALIFLAGYAVALPQHAEIWFNRSILLGDEEWPPDTRIEVTIPNIDQFRHEEPRAGFHELWVPEGAVLRVEARALGEIPTSVRLIKYGLPREKNPDPIVIELGAKAEGDIFEYRFGRVSGSFEFFVTGGDDEDEKPYFRVNVRTAPRVDELLVDYDYPDYINETGREDREGVREYNVVGPRGTDVVMRFRSSADLAEFAIVLDENEAAAMKLEAEAGDPRLFVWRFTLTDDHFYTYRLIGRNGAPSREAPNFNISAQPDLPPEIAIRMPDVSFLDVSPRAAIPLEFIVTDDHRVGEIVYRWDVSREGDFAARHVIAADEILPGDDPRERHVFAPILIGSFGAAEGGEALAPGANLLIALEAADTRSTPDDPEPNRSRYPTLLALNVREPVEIERDLMRGQVRIKDMVQQVEEGLVAAKAELASLIGADEETAFSPDSVHALISRHAILASGLSEAERAFLRIFDGYLYNRLAPSNLTENLIARSFALHREGGASHLEVVAQAVPELSRQIDETEAMGKLTRIMAIMLEVGRSQGPALDAALKRCLETTDPGERGRRLVEAGAAQEALHRSLLLLLDKMEAWEDFQDIIQGLKDIIELEKGLWDRTKKIAK